MREFKYPIGIQTFPELVTDGYYYIDKTGFISSILNNGKFLFLSRPRRFGKSLFVSMLKAYFEGRRELFKGLAIDKEDVDWTPSPVLHFDFNSGLYTQKDGLLATLDRALTEFEELYGLESSGKADVTIAPRFLSVIKRAYQSTGRRVVILIDEYDKPLLGLEDHADLFNYNQRLLKSFYGNLKTADEYIRCGFITGVSRFSKISIFSDLNNLKDVSLDDRFADICGWTEEELTSTFHAGIEALAKKRGEEFVTTLGVMRQYYDGYLFTEAGSRLYNPFSVLGALDSQKIDPYWYTTATPTFLVDLIRKNKIDPSDINGQYCSRRALLQVDVESRNPLPLMFQTGYLTIDRYDQELDEYVLRFPNREVEIGFAENLLPKYLEGSDITTDPLAIENFRRDLITGNPEAFMERLKTAFKDLPGEDKNDWRELRQ